MGLSCRLEAAGGTAAFVWRDIRSLVERHCIVREVGPIPDHWIFGDPVAISAVGQTTLIAAIRK